MWHPGPGGHWGMFGQKRICKFTNVFAWKLVKATKQKKDLGRRTKQKLGKNKTKIIDKWKIHKKGQKNSFRTHIEILN